MRMIPIALAVIFSLSTAFADVVDKESPHDVATTIDRLEQAVKDGGASVIARVEHSKVAEDSGMELRPTVLLIFGNPKMGTPLMQANQAMGVEVPLRVAAYEDADGNVHVVYEDIAATATEYGVDAESEAVTNVSAALEKLTDTAIAEE